MFVLLNEGAFFMLSDFSLIAIAPHETQTLDLGFVGIHPAAVFRRTQAKFSYSSFRVSLSNVFRGASILFLTLIEQFYNWKILL